MPKVAKVIVDVPSRETDRPFDYLISESMRGWIDVGSRVAVPFGRRTVQGFVISLSDHSELSLSRMKPIQELLDHLPPLPPDLVDLAEWMSHEYACSTISALQVMIPAALKGKAERYIRYAEPKQDTDVAEDEPDWYSDSLLQLDEEKQIIDYVKASGPVTVAHLDQRYPGQSVIIKQLLKQGILIESQSIKDRMKIKTVKTVVAAVHGEEAEQAMASFNAQSKRQKEILAFLLEVEVPIGMQELLSTLGATAGTVKKLAEKGFAIIEDVEVFRDPYKDRRFKASKALSLTPEQQAAYDRICETVDHQAYGVFLLHGITGSGKTEVYLQTIERCMQQGRQSIVLVPEISLTPQMVERFKGRFGDKVAVLHSRLSAGERYDEWRRIREGQVMVAVGARSAVFAPFPKLGLIVMDEEHETSYKQEETPKYHARRVAVKRAMQHDAVVILGSATPSLESYHAAKSQTNESFAPILLEMRERPSGSQLPKVEIVDMREELKEGNRSMFSRGLHQAILDRMERKEQAVLFLNRRGYATFVMCRTCGYVAGCPNCDISLTYHQKSNNMRCHYCGYSEVAPSVCPECGSEHIRYFGTGTQRVEGELAKLFPGIRVIRMDVDTTSEKGSHEKLLQAFRDKKADVLLGTQMVAKGLDFPDVTLVGVIAADSSLNFPDFRAAEKTFQLLTQVAGRAGRHLLPGEVFIQSYTPDHYSIIHASHHDYLSFIREELKHRRNLSYPPYCRLILVTLSHENLQLVVRMAENFTSGLRGRAQQRGWFGGLDRFTSDAFDILGPIASPIPKIKNRYRFQCIVKYRGDLDAIDLVREITNETLEQLRDGLLQISIDVDPAMMM
ncbi:primosomal protein N' (replication factor Y) [Paenibacillus shirakamiensis]|uniref:Replication restart protein PriA n=1 Tax=Paenibacillus shirakamiensis TaxID=1265935 RepID=A0ABS4JFI2_9BACL|nr:primosomal protein N' [Paenibacillus shirakamiensis]MBP1999349.1 primosomal protein N' (replication factor Y) [Paenibacillus shirakamiensis]